MVSLDTLGGVADGINSYRPWFYLISYKGVQSLRCQGPVWWC